MVTKQWSRRADFQSMVIPCCSCWSCISGWMIVRLSRLAEPTGRTVIDGGIHQA